MRIALIAHHTAPIAAPFVGGVESHTWYLARWLARQGHDVTLFALPGSDVPGVRLRELSVSPGTFSPGGRKDVATQPEPFLIAHHAYLDVMSELATHCPYDLVHINTLHYLPVAMASSIPVPALLTLHCPPTPWLESALVVATAADGSLPVRLSAVSRTLATAWSHVGGSPAIVPNGVDLTTWKPGPGGPDAVWAGRIVPEKAPHLAIEAARLAGLTLRLAGPILDAEYWERSVRPLLGDGAEYVGHLDHDALVQLVGGSRVSLQSPAWDEPFGLTAAEAISCGTPVAAFARGGLVEVVGPQAGVLALPDDPAALATAVTAAAQLDRGQVRRYAERHLAIDVMGRGYADLYAALGARDAPVPAPHRPSIGTAAGTDRRSAARRPPAAVRDAVA